MCPTIAFSWPVSALKLFVYKCKLLTPVAVDRLIYSLNSSGPITAGSLFSI